MLIRLISHFYFSRAIQKNPDLLSETPIINVFYNDFWGTPLTHSGSHKSYRPLCVLTFRFTHALWGMNPQWFHLGNVVLHTITTAMYTYMARLLTKQTFATMVAALLFASHPIHTEAVAGVVGRADIMACLFFLLAFHCYIKYCRLRDHHAVSRIIEYENSNLTRTNLSKRTNSISSSRTLNSGSLRHSQKTQALRQISETAYRSDEKACCYKGWVYVIGTFVFTAASMLSKEQGLAVLAVCVAYDLFVHQKQRIPYILRSFYKVRYFNLCKFNRLMLFIHC